MQKTTTLESAYKQWQALQPLSQRDQERISRKFSVDFNYNSNHIEGNTLTYGQTELLLLFGRVVQEAEMKDLEDMKASEVGLLMMQEEARLRDYPLTETFIRQLHKTLLREDYEVYRNLPGGVTTTYTIHAGQYKTRPNSVITRYGDRFDYASPEETPILLKELVEWYNAAESRKMYHPADLAILFHYRYIRIHPFEDGNGRIARLLVNYILSRQGYPMVVVRSRKKQEYLEALHQADLEVGTTPSDGANATLDQIKPFADYFRQMMADEICMNIKYVQEKEEHVWWYDGEYIVVSNENTLAILQSLLANPRITVRELTEKIGINKSAIQRQLKQMSEKGWIISPQGPNSQWHVVIKPSMR